jgi:hypothetical protein
MAIINGAQSVDEVMKTVKAGFFSVIRVKCLLGVCVRGHSLAYFLQITWTVSPLSLVVAQKFIPVDVRQESA